MTRKCVTDDQYGQLQRRLDEVARRVDEGTLPFDSAMRALQSFIEGKFEFYVASAANIFKVAVNYARPLMEMIRAGKYDYVNSDIIAKHFPVKGKDILPVELELVHLNKYISSDDAIAEIKQRGFRPAKIEELLAFGEKYPEEQRKYPIVTLGSVWQHWYGGRSVPYLYRHDGRRGLDLNCFEYVWNEDCRFLVVRESVCR